MPESINLIYHRDADGFLSAVIVARFYAQDPVFRKTPVHFHSINYGEDDTFLWTLAGTVIILDFSFPMDVMARLFSKFGDALIWIDHHHTAIEAAVAYEEGNLSQIPGIRQVTDEGQVVRAGCELTEEYFNGFPEVPQVVAWVGAWDTWRWKYTPEIQGPREIVAWASTLPMGGDPALPTNGLSWDRLLTNHFGPIQVALDRGKQEMDRMEAANREIMERYAYEATFAGYPALLVNSPSKGSALFASRFDRAKHQLMVVYQEVRGCYLTVSIYTEDPAIDCGALAQRLGAACPNRTHIRSEGGGHRGAAGFQTTREHLWSLIQMDA